MHGRAGKMVATYRPCGRNRRPHEVSAGFELDFGRFSQSCILSSAEMIGSVDPTWKGKVSSQRSRQALVQQDHMTSVPSSFSVGRAEACSHRC